MSLNLLYSPQPSLQEGFLDKETGLPLSYGLVFFYSDNNRTVLKPIYMLSGSPPNYSYTPLPNPVILSGIGTIQDGNGNDVIPYFYPYDVNLDVELYYIVVTDQFGVQQFTRQGFPNTGSNPIRALAGDNFVPNGQFLLWNPPAAYPLTKYTFDFGGVIGVTDVIDVAPGGWTFQVSTGAVATYTIQFNQLLGSIPNPSASPRYEIEIIRSAPGGHADAVCDLRLRFMDVNKFQSSGVNDTWTLLFNAQAQATLNNVNVHLIRYFGTSGTSVTPADTTEDDLWGGPLTITTSQQIYAVSNIFGLNTGKSIGDNNNDFLEFAIRFPASASQIFDVKLTDFMLLNQAITQSQANSIVFPATTNGEFVLQALSNIAPTKSIPPTTNYYQEDGSNLYLPMVMTTKGYCYDDSSLGNIESVLDSNQFSGSISTLSNLIKCDGVNYRTDGYSALGIPFKRLFNKLYDSTLKLPVAGTGLNFVNAYISTTVNTNIILINNSRNPQTAAADGATATGFTFVVNRLGFTNPFQTYSNNTGLALAVCGLVGAAAGSFNAGTSGVGGAQLISSANTRPVFNMQALAAAALGNGAGVGKYFDYYSTVGGFRMWFKTATETPPAAGGLTLQEVDMNVNYSVLDAGMIIGSAISGKLTQSITTVAAAAIPVSAFFTFFANAIQYFVWYEKNGVGTAPAGSGTNAIKVALIGTETAIQVADKTRVAINSFMFGVPDLRGFFLRGLDDPAQPFPYDLSMTLYRFGYLNANQLATSVGTVELYANLQHNHNGSTVNLGTALVAGGGANVYTSVGAAPLPLVTVAPDGLYESRPLNYNVIYAMRY